jgi:hypothetical protein
MVNKLWTPFFGASSLSVGDFLIMMLLELQMYKSPKAKSHETNSDVGFDGRLPTLGCIVLSI